MAGMKVMNIMFILTKKGKEYEKDYCYFEFNFCFFCLFC